MKDDIKTVIQKAEKLAVKIKKNLHRADLDYTVQVSTNSTNPNKIKFACQITPPAEGIAPITFVASSGKELIDFMEQQAIKLDYDAIWKAYHEFQIKDSKSRIESHEEALAELDKPMEERSAYFQY